MSVRRPIDGADGSASGYPERGAVGVSQFSSVGRADVERSFGVSYFAAFWRPQRLSFQRSQSVSIVAAVVAAKCVAERSS